MASSVADQTELVRHIYTTETMMYQLAEQEFRSFIQWNMNNISLLLKEWEESNYALDDIY